MDQNEAIKIAQRYLMAVNKKHPVECALLFGSFAKGTYHRDSDIDIAIVFKNASDLIDLQIELMHLRNDDDLLIEPHPFISSDFNSSNPVVAEILKYGIELKNFAA
jgi:predicted nucleotidyltransferase